MRLAPLARWGKGPTDTAQLARWQKAPRESLTRAEYASPITRYVHERSYRWCDAFAAGVLAGVLIALAMGAL